MADCVSEHGSKQDFETVLNNAVGEFGKYQLISILLLAIPAACSGFMAADYIFTAARLPHRCVVPLCDGADPEYLPDWISNAIPGTTTGFDECSRYVNITDSSNMTVGDVCPASMFDRNRTESCDNYVYERTNSVVFDFNLQCQEWLRALAGTLNSVGGMVALVIAGYISDNLGRRMSIIFFGFNEALTGVIRAFSVNYGMYVTFQFLQTAIGGGIYSASYILATELVGPKYRVLTSATMSSAFAIGQMIVGLLASVVTEWRHLTLVLFCPVFLTVFYHWIVHESHRWLLSKNKQEQARATLNYAARVNGKTISCSDMDFLLTAIPKKMEGNNIDTERPLILRVVKSRVLLRRCCTTPVWWITTTFIYYGLSINSMPCGKRPLVKKWEKHKDARVITPSRYEQNEASVKAHWKKVIRDLELSYKDDQFWESQRNTVQELVGPIIFRRLTQMFKLPPDAKDYEPQSETASLQASGFFYTLGSDEKLQKGAAPFSLSDFEPSVEEESSVEEEELENWSTMSSKVQSLDNRPSNYQSLMKAKSSMSKGFTSKLTVSRLSTSKSLRKSSSRLKRFSQLQAYTESLALTDDDLIVQKSRKSSRKMPFNKTFKNPHFDMLYCNESETDMIKWNSKYKQKGFEISASDEFSKKAEILTKLISKEFYDWWVGLGNVEFKSEIKRPEDIEDLFQVLFDEHASRALVLDPKILPCVLPSIAKFVDVPKAACPSVLKRQIAYDILAETSPAHKEAFGTCLPQKMKHIPPNNDTKKMWNSLVIPEDLKSMAAVWDDIAHLTSTKAFHTWLQKRPHLPMAKFLKSLETPRDKKQAFVVPSDYVLVKEGSGVSVQELALPVSEFTLELKEVLDVIMND